MLFVYCGYYVAKLLSILQKYSRGSQILRVYDPKDSLFLWRWRDASLSHSSETHGFPTGFALPSSTGKLEVSPTPFLFDSTNTLVHKKKPHSRGSFIMHGDGGYRTRVQWRFE